MLTISSILRLRGPIIEFRSCGLLAPSCL